MGDGNPSFCLGFEGWAVCEGQCPSPAKIDHLVVRVRIALQQVSGKIAQQCGTEGPSLSSLLGRTLLPVQTLC